ncbi:MAG: hypothetical protein KF816_12590 [Melioribacteraceae bacterium]|jgi:ABC-type Fe3+-hydroxamate transport system substrate-binding protein|nr:hypothetical protein [Melioribacteraceae bacterium]
MKKLFGLLLLIAALTTACSSEPPSVRVKNEGANKANVQVKQADGNTININDVNAGSTTSYREIVEGSILATAVIQSQSVSPSIPFNAAEDRNYTVVILNTNPPTLKVDSESK